jgi:hypothetical protein
MWMAPMWYFSTPFHPAFYFHRPVYYGGAVYPGGFNWGNFFLGILVIGALIVAAVWLFRKLAGGGGQRKLRYTTYS